MRAGVAGWFGRHDPELLALHRAVKLAVALPLALGIASALSDNVQLALFASFGTVAILLFADFPGDGRARLSAYLVLILVGAVLVVVGTLCSEVGWLAVISMGLVGFVVTFAGVLSAAAAAATRAALLTFILPVTVPVAASDIPLRLAGWGLAALLAVPAAVLLWPPRDHDALRARTAEACKALGAQLSAARSPATSAAAADAAAAETAQAVLALRTQFRSAEFRPVGLTTGSRLLTHLVVEVDWLHRAVSEIPWDAVDTWPRTLRQLVDECLSVLDACADAVAPHPDVDTSAGRRRLDAALVRLQQARQQAVDSVTLLTAHVDASGDTPSAERSDAWELGGPAGQHTGPAASLAHELGYTTSLVGRTVAASAAADARPVLDRLVGRTGPGLTGSALGAAEAIAAPRITRHSVWWQNSLRAGLGLAAAVLIVELTQVSHSFWVVLGTMSVLRTTALSTGTTAARALLGTFLGFLIGTVLVLSMGTSPLALWFLLPITVLVAGFAPAAISFTAGQAAFTVLVVILFNIIDPVGWSVGLVRIEDVALGGVAGLACGLLLWPHGAGAQIRTSLADSYRSAAAALQGATRSVTDPTPDNTTSAAALLQVAKADAGRLDDALRAYLTERGAKSVPLHGLAVASNVAKQVWVAAEAAAAARPGGADPALAGARAGLSSGVDATARWYDLVSTGLRGAGPGGRAGAGPGAAPDAALAVPAVEPAMAEDAVLDCVATNPAAVAAPETERQAHILWAVALHVDGTTRLQRRLVPVLAELLQPWKGVERGPA